MAFTVNVERNGIVCLYTLCSKLVHLRSGQQRVYFFRRSEELPRRFEVVESGARNQLSFKQATAIAQAYMNQFGVTLHKAAEVAGTLKARVDGLNHEQTAQLIEHIRQNLEE